MKYQLIQVVLLVPVGDESAVDNIDDHSLDHPDQLVAWGEVVEGMSDASRSLTQEQAAKEFQRLTRKPVQFRAELDDSDE